MSLHGTAFIVIWHDLTPGFEEQFERWHTEEHMPERLGVPGFLRGSRYMNWKQSPHVCFTFYELAHIETFRSPGYLARLNAPTEWSGRVMPGMTNFLRGACETVVSLGHGTGGAIASVRIRRSGAHTEASRLRLAQATVQVSGIGGVTSVHLGRQEALLAAQKTDETALRPPPSAAVFDYVMLVEAIDLRTLEREARRIEQVLLDAGAASIELGCYNLGFQLSAPR